MGSRLGYVATASHRRLASLIAPREHGAWGLLLVPLVTGGAVGVLGGGSTLPLIVFAVAAVSIFWLKAPLESWLGRSLVRVQTDLEHRIVGITTLLLAAIGASALAFLLWDGRNRALLLLGLIAIFAFLAQVCVGRLGRKRRMWAQIVGTLGLTVTAPAAYYLATRQLSRVSFVLWLATFLFAANQIHFVQLRIHSARVKGWFHKLEHGRGFLVGELLLATVLLLAWRWQILPGLAALSFLPLLVRGTAWLFARQKPLVVRRLGWTELAHAVVFGGLFTAGFHFGR